MSAPENFRTALIAVYREHPCQVLPNALWKSLSWDTHFETDFSVDQNGRITRLIAQDAQNLMLFWQRERSPVQFLLDSAKTANFVLLHQDFEHCVRLADFSDQEAYFRLIHPMRAIPETSMPRGFALQTADPSNQAGEIADLITRCYAGSHFDPQVVQGWQTHPVFDPQLWVWIMDDARQVPVGLGVAEFDPLVAEGSLEWIQVLPAYRGWGLGKQVVYELLNRLKDRAAFTTVSGRADSQTQPEILYRHCGFEGCDRWWVLRR